MNREDEERKIVVETIANQDFVKFTHMIGTLGQIERNENLIVREDGNFEQYGEEEIEKLMRENSEVERGGTMIRARETGAVVRYGIRSR